MRLKQKYASKGIARSTVSQSSVFRSKVASSPFSSMKNSLNFKNPLKKKESLRLSQLKTSFLLLDVGYTKVQMALACGTRDALNILSYSEVIHWAFDESCLLDLGELKRAVSEALSEIKLEWSDLIDHFPDTIHLSAAFSDPNLTDSYGVVALNGQSVTSDKVADLMRMARVYRLPDNAHLLQTFPSYYKLDGLKSLSEPLTLKGYRLEAACHLLTVEKNVYTLIENAVIGLGLNLKQIYWQPLMAAEASLSYVEKKQGCLFVNIRGLSTKACLFHAGALKKVITLPFGGEHVVHDICAELNLSYDQAKSLLASSVSLEDPLSGLNPMNASLNMESEDEFEKITVAVDIVKARLKDIFDVIAYELNQADVKNQVSRGVVFSGGLSFVSGFLSFAEEHLTYHVRLAQNQVPVEGNLVADKFLALLGLGQRVACQKPSNSFEQSEVSGLMKRWKTFLNKFKVKSEQQIEL